LGESVHRWDPLLLTDRKQGRFLKERKKEKFFSFTFSFSFSFPFSFLFSLEEEGKGKELVSQKNALVTKNDGKVKRL